MIPLRDDAPRFSTPWVTYFLIALNSLVFIFELLLEPAQRMHFLVQFGVVPANLSGLLHGQPGITLEAAVLPVFTSDRKSTRLNSSHIQKSRMPSSA